MRRSLVGSLRFSLLGLLSLNLASSIEYVLHLTMHRFTKLDFNVFDVFEGLSSDLFAINAALLQSKRDAGGVINTIAVSAAWLISNVSGAGSCSVCGGISDVTATLPSRRSRLLRSTVIRHLCVRPAPQLPAQHVVFCDIRLVDACKDALRGQCSESALGSRQLQCHRYVASVVCVVADTSQMIVPIGTQVPLLAGPHPQIQGADNGTLGRSCPTDADVR